MRTSRSILYTAVVTVLSLFYVYQQTEIVKLGYRITSAQQVLDSCLDHKTSLEYSVSRLESPMSLDKSVFFNDGEFQMAESYRLVMMSPGTAPSKSLIAPAGSRPTTGGIFRRFAFQSLLTSRQAEARTVK